jgi:glutamyl-tRNA synthetase
MKFTRGDTVVAFEKLWFLQKRHAGRYASLPPQNTPLNPSHDLEELAVKPMVDVLDRRVKGENLSFYNSIPEGQSRHEYVRSILMADAQNYSNPNDFINRNIYYFVSPSAKSLMDTAPSLKLRNVPSTISHGVNENTLLDMIEEQIFSLPLEEWNTKELKDRIGCVLDDEHNISLEEALDAGDEINEEFSPRVTKAWSKVIHHYLRWAISAGKPGPDGAETMRILGRQETIMRLQTARIVMEGSWQVAEQ